jgi:hypothetical protein
MLDFDSQFNLDITEQDRELLASYQPMTVDRWSQHHQAWLAELHEPIAQCKFCPETFEQQTIWPLVKHAKTVMA